MRAYDRFSLERQINGLESYRDALAWDYGCFLKAEMAEQAEERRVELEEVNARLTTLKQELAQ